MHTTHDMPHLTDADVVRHLDREGDDAERVRREAHLERCADCAARVGLFRGRSETVAAWLSRADHDPRPASAADVLAAAASGEGASAPVITGPGVAGRTILRPSSAAAPWLRAAAIVLLVAAPLAALPPVRAWVAERVGLSDEPGTTAVTAAPAVTADQPVIRFTPAPGVFTVRAGEHPAGASLTLGRADGDDAVLRGAGDAGDPLRAPVVSDDALRLPAADVAVAYTLLLPASVDEVRLVLDGGAVRIPAAALDAGRTVGLPVRP